MKYIAVLLFGLLVIPSISLAQANCGDRGLIVERLNEDYGEFAFMNGTVKTRNPILLEIFLNPETLTWTILQTLPDNKSCVMSVGENLDYAPEIFTNN